MRNILKNYLRTVVLTVIALVMLTLLIIANCYYHGKFGNHYSYKASHYDQLPGWQQDNHLLAFNAFQTSCNDILKQHPATAFGNLSHSGTTQQWQTICLAAQQLKNPNQHSAKLFFEKYFTPYHVTNNFNAHTLFTGYYLPLLHGSLTQSKDYHVPIYAVPSDLVEIKLKKFHQQFSGKKSLYGQLNGNKILPYPNRAAIVEGAIAKSAKVLLWTDNVVDLFFLQIQGSGMVQLPTGQTVLLGYAGSNGRPYTPIGNVLIKQKIFTKKTISMQSIRTWLAQHPNKVAEVLNHDESYIFFHLLDQQNPVGTERVSLTPGRSLAVDTHLIPLGAPIFINTTLPSEHGAPRQFKRLVIAQDTGGAIKGMHADIYWGAGEQAAYIAGNLKNQGQFWILLPK